MMSNGKVVYGAVDMEGSIGQMIIQTDGPRLGKRGNYGALETFASIHALEQQAQSRLKQGRESSLRRLESDPEAIGFTHLAQALQEQDPLTVEIFTQSATYFGIGLSNLLNILHPEKVILGGSLVSSHPSFFIRQPGWLSKIHIIIQRIRLFLVKAIWVRKPSLQGRPYP